MKLEHQRISDPRPLVCLDLETGGLEPGKHPILQIGALRLNSETLAEEARLCVYVLPPQGAEITPQAAAVNGFDRAIWESRGAVELAPALRALAKFCGAWKVPTDAAAHNGLFDFAFLGVEYARLGCDVPWALELCTLKLARCLGAPVVSLAGSCKFFGVAYDRRKAHDALYDAERVAEIMRAARSGRRPARGQRPAALKPASCEYCGAPLVWIRDTPHNAADKSPHRTTCPSAARWSKRAAAEAAHA